MKRDGYMLTPQEMQELEFPLPSYMTGGASELKENWIETDQLANSVSPDQRKLVAMDCEMVGDLFVIAMIFYFPTACHTQECTQSADFISASNM